MDAPALPTRAPGVVSCGGLLSQNEQLRRELAEAEAEIARLRALVDGADAGGCRETVLGVGMSAGSRLSA